MKYLKKFFEFFPTPRFLKFSSVGVHIENDTIHFAELINEGAAARLGRYGKESFVKEGELLSNESLKATFAKLRKEFRINFVKAALPEEETYLFTMEVSGDTDSEIRSEIEFHLEENVPISGADALFDYYFAPTTSAKKMIVVSVVPRETVDRHTTLFTDCGIQPVSFLVESGALSRSIIRRDTKDTDLIVYLSHEKSILAVAVQGFVEFSSTSNFGGGLFNAAIQKELSVDEEEARKIKYSRGFLKADEKGATLSESLSNAMSVLRDEIQRVILYWQKSGEAPAISKIVLCGKDATVPGLSDYLSVSLKMPVAVGDTWTNIPHYSNVVPPIPFDQSLSYSTALGLVIPS